MRPLKLVGVVLFFLTGVSLFADQIVLKNGDRLTGTITKSDDKTLLIKTEFAGDVTIQWSAIDQITSTQALHVAEKSGTTIAGPVTTSGDNLVVTTPAAGSVNVAKADVTALRNDQEQTAFEKGEHPTLMQGWNGGAAVGFGLTAGNSQTESLSLGFNADRPTKTDEIKLWVTSVYNTNNAPGASPSVTANTIQSGARYSRNLTKKIFVFGEGDFQTNALQYLSLRTILTGGFGYHLIKTDKTTLDILAGPGWTHESYSSFTNTTVTPAVFQPAVSNSFAVFSIGEQFMRKLGMGTVLTEQGTFLPNLSDTGRYQASVNVGTVTKISKWFGWQNAFSDIYVTNPPPSTKKNDVVFTTGLNIAFTH